MINRKHKNLGENAIQLSDELDVCVQIPDDSNSQSNFEVTSNPDIKK